MNRTPCAAIAALGLLSVVAQPAASRAAEPVVEDPGDGLVLVSLERFAGLSLGFLTTLVLCVLTAVVGGSLVKIQGIQTLREISMASAGGVMPAVEIISGLVLLIVGALLMTPGFVTDTFGFLMLVPRFRRQTAAWIAERFRRHVTIVEGSSADVPPQGRGCIIDIDPDS